MIDELVARIAAVGPGSGGRRVVGLAGAVSAGKTTLAEQISAGLGDATVITTDVFLLPNAELEARGLTMRKGFPESYDWDRFAATVRAVRRGGALTVPSYSHVLYDIEDGVETEVADATTVIIEGVNALQSPPGRSVPLRYDLAIYLDTAEADQRRWHAERLIELMREASDRPGSFYHGMSHMTDDEIRAFSAGVFDAINGPNAIDHIIPSRSRADVVVVKDADHRLISLSSVSDGRRT